jgi:hypothetical protein
VDQDGIRDGRGLDDEWRLHESSEAKIRIFWSAFFYKLMEWNVKGKMQWDVQPIASHDNSSVQTP